MDEKLGKISRVHGDGCCEEGDGNDEALDYTDVLFNDNLHVRSYPFSRKARSPTSLLKVLKPRLLA